MNSVNKSLHVLAVDCRTPSLDDQFEISPCSELRDLDEEQIQLSVLEHPTLTSLKSQILELEPQIVYCCGRFTPDKDFLHGQLSPLSFQDGSPSTEEDEVTSFVEVFNRSGVQLLYVDAPLSPAEGDRPFQEFVKLRSSRGNAKCELHRGGDLLESKYANVCCDLFAICALLLCDVTYFECFISRGFCNGNSIDPSPLRKYITFSYSFFSKYFLTHF